MYQKERSSIITRHHQKGFDPQIRYKSRTPAKYLKAKTQAKMIESTQEIHQTHDHKDQPSRSATELSRNIALQLLVMFALGIVFLWPNENSFREWLSQSRFSVNTLVTFTWYHTSVLLISIAATLVTPISPLLGLLGSVILSNAFDRYSPENIWNHYHQINHWLALSSLIGTILKVGKDGAGKFIKRSPVFLLLIASIAWVCTSEFYHVVILNSDRSFTFRTWLHALTALLTVAILLQSRLRVWEIDCFTFCMAIPLCLRRFYLGENLYLNHDLPPFAVMAIPFLVVTTFNGHILKRVFASTLAITMAYLIIETENRGGLVGASFAIIGVLILTSWKIIPITALVLPGFFYLVKLLKPSYIQRFVDITTNGAASGTFYSRFTIFSIALSLPATTYAIGTGIGRFSTGIGANNPNLHKTNAHNSWISILVELGLIGLLFYLVLMILGIRAAYHVAKKGRAPFHWIGLASLSAIFGYCGISLSIARDLFLPYYIVLGIAINFYQYDCDKSTDRDV